MSSEDTMKLADAERQKANDLESEAQKIIERAQQQADGMRQQARDHSNRANDLNSKAQNEQQQELQEADKQRRDVEKELEKEKGTGGLFG